jgi:hypothetical protein
MIEEPTTFDNSLTIARPEGTMSSMSLPGKKDTDEHFYSFEVQYPSVSV